VRNKARRWGVAQAWESSEVTRDFQVAYYGSGWERAPVIARVGCGRLPDKRVWKFSRWEDRPHLLSAGR